VLARLALDRSWLDVLDRVARAEGLALSPPKLASAVRALSGAYNAGEFARSRASDALAARLSFSFPRDVPKSACAARELAHFGLVALPSDRALRVLDVGAGLGASTWGLARLLALHGARGAIDATMIDEDARALALASRIADARRREGEIEVRVSTRATSARSFSSRERYDVVLVGQSLGEIDARDDAQISLLGALLEGALERDGSLVVIEPALRDRTRRLHRVRDALAQSGVTIFAPCLHAAPCPMLARETDWCHEDLPIDLPSEVAAIARAAGLRWQGLTFSYLVLRRDGATLRDRVAPGARRVVSLPIVTKGKSELMFCAGEGSAAAIRRVARLDRDAPKDDDAWTRATRGDVLAFDPPLGVDEERVARATRVRIEPLAFVRKATGG